MLDYTNYIELFTKCSMKKTYKKIIVTFNIMVCLFFNVGCTSISTNERLNSIGMLNPWVDCHNDLQCAQKIAKFSFPLVLSNFNVRAMKDMIEITYPIDEYRDVVVRKTTEELYNKTDISGNYNKYPTEQTLIFENGVEFKVKRDEKLIYVAYFGASSGYYSISCLKGITEKELFQIYTVIAEAEAPKTP